MVFIHYFFYLFEKKRNSSSLDENKLGTLLSKKLDDLCDFTRKSVLRIYPSGARVDSSNYDPMLGFQCGA